MSRRRHRPSKQRSSIAEPSIITPTRKDWPYRDCDFESYDDDHPRAAELEAAEVERFYAGGAADRMPNLSVRRAQVRTAARRAFEKRGEKIPDYLAEKADERAAVTQAAARWCAEFNALRADARREFESRSQKVPAFLQHQEPCDSLEAELARSVADIAAVRALIANIEEETGRLRSEAATMREQFDSSPEGEEIFRLRSECRQTISNILQLDADTARHNRNSELLLGFCDAMIGARPKDLPPSPKLSRYSTDLEFLRGESRRCGFDVPSSMTSIAELSGMIRSQVPPNLPPKPAAKPVADEREPSTAKTRKVVRRRTKQTAPGDEYSSP